MRVLFSRSLTMFDDVSGSKTNGARHFEHREESPKVTFAAQALRLECAYFKRIPSASIIIWPCL